jgi:N-acetylglucosaminyldiphosphoundecaprenol N-acetyl-beta-D-mannosaminyltransferase
MALTERATTTAPVARRARVNILGVGVDAIDLATAVRTIFNAVEAGSGGYVCVTGVHGIMEAQRDPGFRRMLNRSLLTTPDGMPTVWVGRMRGYRIERVYGPDLMLAVCKHSLDTHRSHFFLGGADGVVDELQQRLAARFPGLRVVGSYTPPFRPLTDDEEDSIVRHIREVRADIVWVGLSTPKQERLMARMQSRVAPAVMIGVGAAFDFHSGRVSQAPRWMQRNGLEWLYRTMQEPRRLAPRYARNNLPFLYRVVLQGLGVRRYSLET